MFTPNQLDVRRFFCSVYQKWRHQLPMQAIESLAAQWIQDHPDYHDILADEERALAQIGMAYLDGQDNPFLHLSMHLSISEQCTIDQPQGVQKALSQLSHQLNSLHLAHHIAMEGLGHMLWESQQKGIPPDAHAYLEFLYRKIQSS